MQARFLQPFGRFRVVLEVYAWLKDHVWEYGFILRYPDGKTKFTGTDYEPWHYRYVGKDAAKEIYKKGLCLEEYLAK